MPSLKGGQEFAEQTTIRVEDVTRPDLRHPGVDSGDGIGRRFPFDNYAGEEIVARPGVFVEEFVAAVTVVPDRRA